jgi:tripartite-type tricarboxylate transporter receptor subunit TctC
MVWYGVCAPAGVPKPIVNKVAADVQQALATPEVMKRMEGYGVDVQFMGPEKFAAYMKSESAKWAKVIRQAKIEPQ